MQTETALILKIRNVSENDISLTLLTESSGRFDAKLKSAKKVTSRNSSKVDILNLVNTTLVEGTGMRVITDISLLDDFSYLKHERNISMVWLVSEILDTLSLDNDHDLLEIFTITSDFLANTKKIFDKPLELDKMFCHYILQVILASGFDINFEYYEDTKKLIEQSEERYMKFQDKSHNLVFTQTGKASDLCDDRLFKILKFLSVSYLEQITNLILGDDDLKKLKEIFLNWIEDITSKKLNSRKLVRYR